MKSNGEKVQALIFAVAVSQEVGHWKPHRWFDEAVSCASFCSMFLVLFDDLFFFKNNLFAFNVQFLIALSITNRHIGTFIFLKGLHQWPFFTM